MTQAGYFIAALVIAGAFAAYSALTQPKPLEPTRQSGRVDYVKDGDSLRIKGVKPDIRLFGVDAPEKGDRGSQQATDALKRYAPKGRAVSFIQMDTDRYGRIVARVFLKDGREINRMMIEQGGATEYCKYSKGFYGQCD